MLRTEALRYRYPDTTLRFPDFRLPERGSALILGQSGSGKTTLLHLLAGLRRVQEGHIWLGQTDMSQLSETARDRFRGQHIGLVFQRPHFIQSLSVEDNVRLAAFFGKRPTDRKRARALLDRLGLDGKARKYPKTLSQGEQQRVSIARALMNAPLLILADEPTSSLDDANCQQVAELLREQAAETGAMLLIVTHDNRLKPQFEHQIRVGTEM